MQTNLFNTMKNVEENILNQIKESSDVLPVIQDTYNNITFILNSKKVTIKNPDPTMSLLDFLRYHTSTTGTRKFCNQGGCGVCIVMHSYKDSQDGLLRNVSINACMKKLVQCHGTVVTTTEGIGSSKTGFHAVQSRIAYNQGLQCGACTPGQVMSIYTCLQPNTFTQDLSNSNKAEKMLDGNLCRCSCYLGIIKTAKSFSLDKQNDADFTHDIAHNVLSDINANKFSDFLNEHSELNTTLLFKSGDFDTKYYLVNNLNTVSKILNEHSLNDIELTNGNTGSGIYGKSYPKIVIDISRLSELHIVNGLEFGAAVPYNKIVSILKKQNNKSLSNFAEHVYHIAGQSVRNAGSLGGALALVKHKKLISDATPCLMALNAVVKVLNLHTKEHHDMSVNEYLLLDESVHKLLIISIKIPMPETNEHFNSFRLAKRQVNAVSFINAAFNYKLDGTKVVECNIVYGAVSQDSLPVHAINTCNYLIGKELNQTTFSNTLKTLNSEIVVGTLDSYSSQSKVDGIKEERQKYVGILFYKSMLQLLNKLGLLSEENKSGLSVLNDEISTDYDRYADNDPYARVYGTDETSKVLNQSMIKGDSAIIASGEAKYTDDVPNVDNMVYGRIVHTTVSNGSVDETSSVTLNSIEKARNTPGVKLVLTCWEDEINFVGGQVNFLGFNPNAGTLISNNGSVVAIVYATSPDLADKVGSDIVVEYKDVDYSANTLELALENKNFTGDSITSIIGEGAPELPAFTDVNNVDENASSSSNDVLEGPNVVEGEIDMAGVLHFYLENNSTTVLKNPLNAKYIIYTAAQALGLCKSATGKLGLEAADYEIRSMRVGGGFGGKIVIPKLVTYYALLGAIKLNTNIKFYATLKEETSILNGRPRILYKQRVGFTDEGLVTALRRQYYGEAAQTDFNPNLYAVPFKFNNVYSGADLVNLPRGLHAVWRGASRPEKNMNKLLTIDLVAGKLNKPFDEIMKVNLLDTLENGNDPAYLVINKDPEIFKTLVNKLHNEPKYNYKSRVQNIKKFNAENKWKKRSIVTCPMADEIDGSFVGDLLLGSKETMALIKYHSGEDEQFFYGKYTTNYASDDSFRVNLLIEGAEIGQGVQQKAKQAFAQFMECPVEYISIETASSEYFPAGNGLAGGSQGTLRQVESCKGLCRQFRRQWGEFGDDDKPLPGKEIFGGVGAEQLGLTDEEWDALTRPEKLKSTWEYRVRLNQNNLAGKWNTVGNNKGTKPIRIIFVIMTELEVDCLSGVTTVREINSINEIGESWNPAIDAGNIEGGTIMGIGVALTESREYDENNMPLNYDTWTYKIPSTYELPYKITTELNDSSIPFDDEQFPTKSNYEGGTFSQCPVFLAVKEAVRAFRSENNKSTHFKFNMPASPNEVLKALELDDNQLTL